MRDALIIFGALLFLAGVVWVLVRPDPKFDKYRELNQQLARKENRVKPSRLERARKSRSRL
jgi:hypothetical protein